MWKFFNKRTERIGKPPGTPEPAEGEKRESVVARITDYAEGQCLQQTVESLEECPPRDEATAVRWLDLSGVHDVTFLEQLGESFSLHPLVLEDIAHTAQRPKVEDYEEYLYVVAKILSYNSNTSEVEAEQISLILGPDYVISFQEREPDVFQPIRERIIQAKGRIRKMGADYLAYALVDLLVDGYFKVLEKVSEALEDLHEEVTGEPTDDTLKGIHSAKRELIFLRKSVWPLREAINNLARTDFDYMSDATRLYLRDVYDHTIQVIDTLESFRDLASGMLDTYLTSISNRMNEVMKVLTIIATIFIPLTFIAGIYGMNFEYMPELQWKWAYPAVWALMLGLAGLMLVFFKRKNWI